LINLSIALIENEIIKTTLPKAKELRPFIEKLMTISKKDTLINRRSILSVIKNKELVTKLFSDISIRIKDRDGGYTRIMHNGFRAGDKAPMAVIELVDRKVTNNKEKDITAIAKPKVEDKQQEDNLT
jgi:large subunit ribosomal protein L17